MSPIPLTLRTATPDDFDWIHELRHRVYAQELGQHTPDPSGQLRDGLDGDNIYLVAARGDARIGFVSLTPPWPERTRWWIDESYLGYVGPTESLAHLAAADPRAVVCTSMSKMNALSGVRAAYLVAEPATATELRRWTPPWPVSLPAQLAAVSALRDPAYYSDCWARTAVLRGQLAADLSKVDNAATGDESVVNFLTVTLPPGGPTAAQVVDECRRHDVYLRDLSPMSSAYQGRTIRIAVKDTADNTRIVAAYRAARTPR